MHDEDDMYVNNPLMNQNDKLLDPLKEDDRKLSFG